MILFQATPPTTEVVLFWERIFPGFWNSWIGAAQAALNEIDAAGVDDIIITSWFRSPFDNRAVKGDPDSQHLVGLALDVVPAKHNLSASIDEAAASFAEFGFISVPSPTHLHIQTFPAGILRRVGVLDALSV